MSCRCSLRTEFTIISSPNPWIKSMSKGIPLETGREMRTIYTNRLNNRFSLTFLQGYLDRHTWKEEDCMAQRLKHCDNNKHEDICPNVYNDNFSPQKFKWKSVVTIIHWFFRTNLFFVVFIIFLLLYSCVSYTSVGMNKLFPSVFSVVFCLFGTAYLLSPTYYEDSG